MPSKTTQDGKMTKLYEFRTRRIKRSFAYEDKILHDPTGVATFLLELTKDLDREHFYALYLDVRGKLIGFEVVAVGGLASVEVHPREVFRGAILAGAFSIVVAHNHPSGDSKPSEEDKVLTIRLMKAGVLMGIPVVDHIVVAPGAPAFSEAMNGFI